MKKKILILDDHPMMREGLTQLINHESDLKVVGEADRASQALDAVASTKPDLILVDINLPGRNGLEFIKDLQALHPGMAMLVISMHDENLYAERVLRAGGRGYIMKQEGGKKIMEAIRKVLDGGIYVSEKMSASILETMSGRGAWGGDSAVKQLTDREFEVFQLIGQGKNARQMADQLRLSVKTIEVHRANIREKLKIKTVPELIRFAVRWTETH